MNKPASTTVLDGLYDRLVDERLSAELASLIEANQASVLALPAEERSTRLAEAFVKILVGILDGVEPDEAGTPREQAQMAVIAGLLGLLRKEYRAADMPSWPRPLSALRSIHRQSAPFVAPATGVLRPWLFTAGRADPSLLADLRAELDSARGGHPRLVHQVERRAQADGPVRGRNSGSEPKIVGTLRLSDSGL
ncbi:MAG: hypothetical protein A3G81_14005 [Betaproteobacteria bacterium RIFCSPLOWO2_12_FULL_65_14]|nr:MAG: hypothetical protein A3G81_14005 [Betaproteobacteria bacterium RIFCSPLOWO2_12_FULL_65_14]